REIVKARKLKRIETTTELTELLYPILKSYKKEKIHPLTLVYQALRIGVNDELRALEEFLEAAIDCLSPGGRLGVITFHSLEDRIVKQCFRHHASDKDSTSGLSGLFLDKKPRVKLLATKPIVPSEEEILANPRARSAKLRGV